MRDTFKNASYNTFGYIFPIALSILAMPYMVRKLTTEVYGIYILCVSIAGMLSFLDMGFGQGIVRFVSKYEAQNDHERINGIIKVTFTVHALMGVVGAAVIYLLSGFLAGRVFKIAPEYAETAAFAFNIAAIGFFINFIAATFSNISKALQRYDIFVKIQNSVFFFQITSAVTLLYMGRGLIEILVAQVFSQTAGLLFFYAFSKRILPTLKVGFGFNKEIFKEIFGFSVYTAMNEVTSSAIYRGDKIIIGALLGTEAVTFYSVSSMLVQMANGLIHFSSQSLMPGISYAQSLLNREMLKGIYKKSVRFALTAGLLINVPLILLGDVFLTLWMGKEFAEKSAYLIPVMSLIFFLKSPALVALWFCNGIGRADMNFMASTTSALLYLLGAALTIPVFGLMGAAISLAFVLVPHPVYFYSLNRMLGVNSRWFVAIFSRAIIAVLSAIALRQFITFPGELGWFIFISLSIVAGVLLVAYAAKIFLKEDFTEILERFRP